MSFESALRKRLIQDDAVAAMVADRVHWKVRPQNGALPAIVLLMIHDPRPQHLGGFQSLRPTRIQADCYGRTYDQARELREAVIAVLAAKATEEDTRFDVGFINDARDRLDETAAGAAHVQLIDATIWQGQME